MKLLVSRYLRRRILVEVMRREGAGDEFEGIEGDLLLTIHTHNNK